MEAEKNLKKNMIFSAKSILKVSDDIPLIGHVAFGIIDRGTNLLQLRPSSLCPLSCIFCSVDAGPKSRFRRTEFIVDLDYMLEYVKIIAEYKAVKDLQIHIDAAGDPLTYPRIVDLIFCLSELKNIKVISLETHGALLNYKLLDEMDEAGLSRLNLSIDTLDPQLAKYLSGSKWFDLPKVLEFAEYIAENLKMDLLIAPVWIPGVNDEDMPRIIKFAKKIGAGKKWPPLGIQKYEVHRYGRKPKGVKPMTWYKFYQTLKKWEKAYNVKLVLNPRDFGIYKVKPLPLIFKKGQKISVKVIGWGWHKNEWLGVAKDRIVAIIGAKGEPPVGSKVKVEIVRNKNNIYVGVLG